MRCVFKVGSLNANFKETSVAHDRRNLIDQRKFKYIFFRSYLHTHTHTHTHPRHVQTLTHRACVIFFDDGSQSLLFFKVVFREVTMWSWGKVLASCDYYQLDYSPRDQYLKSFARTIVQICNSSKRERLRFELSELPSRVVISNSR